MNGEELFCCKFATHTEQEMKTVDHGIMTSGIVTNKFIIRTVRTKISWHSLITGHDHNGSWFTHSIGDDIRHI